MTEIGEMIQCYREYLPLEKVMCVVHEEDDKGVGQAKLTEGLEEQEKRICKE